MPSCYQLTARVERPWDLRSANYTVSNRIRDYLPAPGNWLAVLLGALSLLGLYAISRYNFLLFHCLAAFGLVLSLGSIARGDDRDTDFYFTGRPFVRPCPCPCPCPSGPAVPSVPTVPGTMPQGGQPEGNRRLGRRLRSPGRPPPRTLRPTTSWPNRGAESPAGPPVPPRP